MFLQVSSFSIKQILLSLAHRWRCQICSTLPGALIYCSLWFHISSSAASVTPWRVTSNRTRWGCHSSRSRTLVNKCSVCCFLSYSSVFRSFLRSQDCHTRQIANDDSACGLFRGWTKARTDWSWSQRLFVRSWASRWVCWWGQISPMRWRMRNSVKPPLVRLMKSWVNMSDSTVFMFRWLYACVCFMFVRLQGSSSRGIA